MLRLLIFFLSDYLRIAAHSGEIFPLSVLHELSHSTLLNTCQFLKYVFLLRLMHTVILHLDCSRLYLFLRNAILHPNLLCQVGPSSPSA